MEQRRTRERGYLEAYLQIAPILLGLCLVVLVGLGRVLAACLRVTTSFRRVLLLGALVIRLSFLVVVVAFLLMACTVSGSIPSGHARGGTQRKRTPLPHLRRRGVSENVCALLFPALDFLRYARCTGRHRGGRSIRAHRE